MRILGIDPGTAITGFGIIDKQNQELSIVDYGSIQTAKKPQSSRLEEIEKDFKKIIAKYKPDCVAVEELFIFKNLKTAIQVGQARGVILLTSQKTKKPIYEYTPLQIKQALTGNGRASKSQVQSMVKAILKLSKIPKPDDAADALACAICCANSISKYKFKAENQY